MIDVRYEPFLSRIEVLRGGDEDAVEAAVAWRVSVSDYRDDLLVLKGFVKVAQPEGTGRVLVHGALMPRFEEDSLPDLSTLLDSSPVEGCVEAMYDVARRCLNMQAALMDFTFDLPYQSPETVIRRKPKTPEPAK